MRKDRAIIEYLYKESVFITESRKEGKLLVQQGRITQDEFNNIVNIDPTPNKKYVGWMCKQWAAHTIADLTALKEVIEGWERVIASSTARAAIKNTDIYSYTFDQVAKIVNEQDEAKKNLPENNYEVLLDTPDILMIAPYTHEASREQGLRHFAIRVCFDEKDRPTGQKDCAWCTTFKSPDHWNQYYYGEDKEFRYIKVKSEAMKQKLLQNGFKEEETVIAVVIPRRGNKIIAFDGYDKKLDTDRLMTLLQLMNIS